MTSIGHNFREKQRADLFNDIVKNSGKNKNQSIKPCAQ